MKGDEGIVLYLIKKGARVRAANKTGEVNWVQNQKQQWFIDIYCTCMMKANVGCLDTDAASHC